MKIVCFYVFLFESLSRDVLRGICLCPRQEKTSTDVCGFECFGVRVEGAGEAKSKNNTYNQNGSIGA